MTKHYQEHYDVHIGADIIAYKQMLMLRAPSGGIALELDRNSTSIYPGGTIKREDLIRLRDWLCEVLHD